MKNNNNFVDSKKLNGLRLFLMAIAIALATGIALYIWYWVTVFSITKTNIERELRINEAVRQHYFEKSGMSKEIKAL